MRYGPVTIIFCGNFQGNYEQRTSTSTDTGLPIVIWSFVVIFLQSLARNDLPATPARLRGRF